MTDPARFADAVTTALAAMPAGCQPWGRGWSAAVAGVLEAAAAKPGNVHPDASFPDLRFDDLAAAALAAAPAIDAAAERPLGETILAAVAASRAACRSNANLGIVLLIAPLAAVPDAAAVRDDPRGAVEAILAGLDASDAAAVWRAIALARPGGLGRSGRWDLAGPAPADIREAMRHAADRDTIARLWADGYGELFEGAVADLDAAVAEGVPLAEAIVRCQLRQLARCPDSLLARRHGAATAAAVSARAAALVEQRRTPGWPADLAAFDRALRAPRRLNPGTTADLIAAALYILLRDGRLRPALPFPTPLFPDTAARRHGLDR